MNKLQQIDQNSHNLLLGYILWLVGFTGAHRFFYGKPKTGTLYFFTLGLLGIGWIVDLFLIPGMDRKAGQKFKVGEIDYNICWVFLVFLGVFGVHRLYLKKYVSALIYFLTGGLFLIGYLYDLWTLNNQIEEVNQTH